MTGISWSVGALAKATGLTVRTLHHYDELGLLRPSARTASGHRRYTAEDARRLFRVRLLRGLDVPLDRIAEVLDAPDVEPLRALLADHVDRLDDEVERLTSVRERTRGLLARLDEPDDLLAGRHEDLLALHGRTSLFDDGLTQEQAARLEAQAEAIGPEVRRELDVVWRQALAEVVEHHRAGTSVDDPAVRRTVERLRWVVGTFTGGDPELAASLSAFFRDHGDGVADEVVPGGTSDGWWDYLTRASTAY
ncbi:MerR family transcriptional regulator [Actinosynnema sp. NPDC020468]|uniref:MerR family transcriptional regulator n=1 Tax=Actinosynnema sp. NPDC020468 TaxID=3154488 RepID=UPI0033E88EFC